ICASTLAMMHAGVPIAAPVAGIAMGLINTGENYSILTDIQGMEDALGDMDFKVAGTAKGITALQMDIKIDGLSKDILEESMEQAKSGRLKILDSMLETISEPNTALSDYAPKITTMSINPDKIRDVIGPSGKQINQIIDETGDKIEFKIDSLSKDIIEESREQDKSGRLKILDSMLETISEPNTALSDYAPKITTMSINPDKIRDVMGPSGKQSNQIIDETGFKIDIEQDGSVYISSTDQSMNDKAKSIIEDLVREVEVGQIYLGT